MSFVPVTGPATFEAVEPARDSVVVFTDDHRTVSLPIRAALPVLTRAHQRDDAHPTVGLLAGAVLLAMRMVAAGKIEPDQRAGWPETCTTAPRSLSRRSVSYTFGCGTPVAFATA